MRNTLLRTAVALVSFLVSLAWLGCAAGPSAETSEARAAALRNPTRELVDRNYPQNPPATGVEAISVPSYVVEPAASYQLGETARALAESGIELVVMDPPEPRSLADRSRSPEVAADFALDSAAHSEDLISPFSDPQPLGVGPPGLTTSFGSVDYTTNPAENMGFAFIPPDPHSAAGPNHVVNVVNTVIRFHQKNGTVDFTDSLEDFFAAEMPDTATFDPKVVFDHYAGRFVVVTLEKEDDGAGGNPEVSEIFVAVSDDADPNGMWCTTTIVSTTNILGIDRWADYPGLAIDEEVIYITNNMFGFSTGGGFAGVRLWVVDKGLGKMGLYDCGTAMVSILDPYAAAGAATTTQPAQISGVAPAGVGTFMTAYSGLTNGTSEFVQITRIDNPLTAPLFTVEQINIGNIEDFASFLNAPQSGPPLTPAIATNDRRALDAKWYNNRLWTTASISPKVGDTDAGEITAHWWEFNTTTLGASTLVQQGNIFGDDAFTDLFTFFPSVAVNGIGQAAFGYSGSSGATFGSSYYTTRNAGDAAGSTQGTGTLQAGVATYFRQFCGPDNRWGDYSGTSVDPVDGCFWFYNEHAMTTGNPSGCNAAEIGRWATHNGKMCPTGACPADMFLEDISLAGTQTRKAGSRITTGENVTIPVGANVTFQSQDLAVFLNGLSVLGTMTVQTQANPCL